MKRRLEQSKNSNPEESQSFNDLNSEDMGTTI